MPIFTLIAFSFQKGRYLTLPFEGVSLRWYVQLFHNDIALNALWNSTLIAAIAMFIATVLGAMAAIVAVRYRFRGKLAFQALTGAPLAFPQLLLGIVLLLWFSVLGRWFGFYTGLVTAIIGHVVYITPFVMVIVAVQVYTFDPALEDAARDCGASTWEVYRHISIPLLWPGIFSAAIFAFLLSWGNFYLTYSLAGSAAHDPDLHLQRYRNGVIATLPRHCRRGLRPGHSSGRTGQSHAILIAARSAWWGKRLDARGFCRKAHFGNRRNAGHRQSHRRGVPRGRRTGRRQWPDAGLNSRRHCRAR